MTQREPLLSVIIPVYNEGDQLLNHIQHVINQLGVVSQVIVVDGGSTDSGIKDSNFVKLKKLAQTQASLTVISSPKGRALQMNAGARLATADNLVFLHADTLLPKNALSVFEAFSTSRFLWGRFDVQLNNKALAYKVVSWFINKRSRLTSIATGDQAIFVRRRTFESINGYAELPLMEDIALSKCLKKKSKPYCVKAVVTTSARKWEKEGLMRTVWLMWCIRAAYARGVSPNVLVKKYYKP